MLKNTVLLFCAVLLSGCALLEPIDWAAEQDSVDAGNPELQAAISANVPAFAYRVTLYKPDSAGGVSAKVTLRNLTGQPLKYMRATVTPYNAVGDVQRSQIGGYSSRQITKTGPIKVGGFGDPSGKKLWYNETITCATVDSIELVYMDGTIEKLDSKPLLETALSSEVSRDCQPVI